MARSGFFNLNPVGDKEDNKIKLSNLITTLSKNFPIQGIDNFCLFAFSNEAYIGQVLSKLNNILPIESSKIKAALLFGESSFLSMLPELGKHATLVILADIEPQLHVHTKHLLTSMIKSSSISEFIEYYKINNPIKNNDSWSIEQLIEGLHGNGAKQSLGEYHFLFSEMRFRQCQEAVNILSFINIHLNMFNENQCEKFASILDSHSTSLTFCNFTNIHHYDELFKLRLTTELILNKSPGCFLMYATGSDRSDNLSANFSVNLEDYYNLNETHSKPDIAVIDHDIDLDFELDTLYRNRSNNPTLPKLLHNSSIFTSSLGKKISIEEIRALRMTDKKY